MAKMQPVPHGVPSGEERGFFSVSPLLRLAERLFSARKNFLKMNRKYFSVLYWKLVSIGMNLNYF